MAFLRILFVCALVFGLSNCRKKSETVGKEVREAGYAMTPEGWFGAIRDNDVAVLRKMAQGGFDVKTKDAEGDGAMHVAAAMGAKEAAEFFLNKGLAIDTKGAKGRTPLMAAVMADRPKMVQWLLSQGADPKPKDDDGFIALMLAVTNGGKESVEELAPYHREDLDSALLMASLVGEAEVIDALTNYGASVYARMEDGRTPLMLAAQNGHRQAAALLIDIGASRFANTEGGDTAQSLAVAAGHAELAELIEKGFSGDLLALETDEQVTEALGEYIDEFQSDPEEPDVDGSLTANSESATGEVGDTENTGDQSLVANDAEGTGAVLSEGGASGRESVLKKSMTSKPVRSLEGETVSITGVAVRAKLPDEISQNTAGATGTAAESNTQVSAPLENLPLVMRHYRQRELPVEVKKVSGGVASLNLPGPQPKQVQVSQGETIPGSNILVVRVFSRMEQGKLNGGAPIEVGVVEVEDKASGLKREWLEGRPASAHDPVALVEDATTGQRYVAKPGQKFHSEDGREFIVNDVRPSQLVIEDVSSGEVRTLRLRGPRG
ncbi:MAG: ankyrin repeat domain-containing protein [Akkermansiaceae bacterium]|nr:ankyrin repeat domain-containing protein [Akkermansiaceae bacterium]